MIPKPQARSRSGCFTCRRRKKKCDESAYPDCRNCTSNKLQCSWPDHVVSAQEQDSATVSKESVRDEQKCWAEAKYAFKSGPHANGITKPEKKRKTSILQRISMQQDCVDEYLEDIFRSSDPVQPVRPVGAALELDSTASLTSIRDRIARQMDISGEELNKLRRKRHNMA
ncbi:hypothetical protein OXX80_008208 [Metschnikowia pulcherrima]